MATWFTFGNLYTAYKDCRKRKSNTLNHLRFFNNLGVNLVKLENELTARTYRPGRSIAFVVERPKIREIFAASFRDRVIHHLLYNYLAPKFERIFIYDSWACRIGKGTHGAMLRVRQFARELERDRSGAAGPNYYLKMDIKSFFTTIDKEILYGLVAKKIKNEEILWLTKVIIDYDPAHDIPPKVQSRPSLFERLPSEKSLFRVAKGKGLPIGNLTSQFFANVYLNELDQFVKHTLKAKRYVRYVDDFLIFDSSKERLEQFRDQITAFLADELALTVHPSKVFIRPLSNGVDFVGYVVRADYVLIRRRVVWQLRQKLGARPALSAERRREIILSYLAHFRWANARELTASLVMPGLT